MKGDCLLTGGEGQGVISLSSDSRDRILCAFFFKSMLSQTDISFTTWRNEALQLSEIGLELMKND